MTPLYLGNINSWKKLAQSVEPVMFFTAIKIPKKSYINRSILATANGLQSLSIPLEGGRGNYMLYKDVKISYAEKWNLKHVLAIKTAYSKSPFYEYYGDKIQQIIMNKEVFLLDLNLKLFEQLNTSLKLHLNFNINSTESQFDYQTLDIPNDFNPMEAYPQVFRNKYDFQTDLSILDLLFNLGPRSKEYLLK